MRIRISGALLASALVGICLSASSYAEDVRLFVRHEVTDYAAWHKAYLAAAPLQKKMGVFFKDVYQSADNPNDITIIHDFHSIDEAKAFVTSPELRATMAKSGVKPPAQVWISTKAGKG